jgi:hypothetical protein
MILGLPKMVYINKKVKAEMKSENPVYKRGDEFSSLSLLYCKFCLFFFFFFILNGKDMCIYINK